MSTPKKEKIKRVAYVLAGMIILQAHHRYDDGHGNYNLFVVSGLIFLSIGIFHHKLECRFPWTDTFFYVIEAILSFLTPWEYFETDKKSLPFAYIFAGLMQIFSDYIFRSRMEKYSSSFVENPIVKGRSNDERKFVFSTA